MGEKKTDYIFKYIKDKEEKQRKIKKKVKIISLVVSIVLYVLILVVLIYVAFNLFKGVIGTINLIESNDSKLVVSSIFLMILGFFVFWFAMFGLPQIFPIDLKSEKND